MLVFVAKPMHPFVGAGREWPTVVIVDRTVNVLCKIEIGAQNKKPFEVLESKHLAFAPSVHRIPASINFWIQRRKLKR